MGMYQRVTVTVGAAIDSEKMIAALQMAGALCEEDPEDDYKHDEFMDALYDGVSLPGHPCVRFGCEINSWDNSVREGYAEYRPTKRVRDSGKGGLNGVVGPVEITPDTILSARVAIKNAFEALGLPADNVNIGAIALCSHG